MIAGIGATRTSYTTYIIPIVGVAWGWLLLDEALGLDALLGIAVIFLGLAIASGRPQPAAESAPAARARETQG